MEDKKMLKDEELEKVNGGAGLEMKDLIGSPLADAADPAQVSGGFAPPTIEPKTITFDGEQQTLVNGGKVC